MLPTQIKEQRKLQQVHAYAKEVRLSGRSLTTNRIGRQSRILDESLAYDNLSSRLFISLNHQTAALIFCHPLPLALHRCFQERK